MIQKDKQKTIMWRKNTREVFKTYFKKGYTAIDFVLYKNNGSLNCYHVLQKNEVFV